MGEAGSPKMKMCPTGMKINTCFIPDDFFSGYCLHLTLNNYFFLVSTSYSEFIHLSATDLLENALQLWVFLTVTVSEGRENVSIVNASVKIN